jgi:N-acetyl-anhydromuramyl-L-alanine amidase AmpD
LQESVADIARHLQIVQRAHLQRGMVDIAYHFAVDRAGRLWQLRWLNYQGQHVRIGKNGVRWNEHNVGIVALGDFNLQPPTAAQKDRLLMLVRMVRQKYAVNPGNIKLHGELVETDCPGKRLAPLIREARRNRLV